ncbi:MAG: asparagine synthase (glutamine-hydrolyzing) [Pseudodesulfovibrio aespoeensis]|nr:asparagine synthase (glutamine-hydrolyzing) [Pseudodesulfovibrio aespoeensis]
MVEAMESALLHRGPDHSGRFSEHGAALGMNRLAIIDLDTGSQPIFNENGNLVIIYNGELYNYQGLRNELTALGHRFSSRSDTEVVLHAFEEFGPGCLHRFNGMYAFAIWNRSERNLFMARDRLGIKPLYYITSQERLCFASEERGLIPCMENSPTPNWTAIARYLQLGYIASPDSPFSGVSALPAGHWAEYAEGTLAIHHYWEPTYGSLEGVTAEEAEAETERLLRRSVELELMSDVPVGLFLSGGLDSSAVAAYARELSPERFCSYILQFEETTHDESGDARFVADTIGIPFKEYFFSNSQLVQSLQDTADVMDAPFGDSTVLPLLALSRYAREDVKVVLTGWGGDELFAGYPTYKAHLLAQAYRKIPDAIGQRLVPWLVCKLPVSDAYMSFEFKAKRFVDGMNLPPELQHFSWMGYFSNAEVNALLHSDVLNQQHETALAPIERMLEFLPEKDIISRILHLDSRYFMEGNGLFQLDRISMAASLEARVPLLNFELLEYVNSLPAKIKMLGGKPKGLLKRIMVNRLPRKVVNKPKKGFGPPSSAWLRGPLRSTLIETFSPDRIARQRVFNPQAVNRLISQHMERRQDNGRKLWALLSLQLWLDRFIMGQGRS